MIDSIKHSAVLSRCHSHCLLIHGQRNCLIKVSSTVSPWRESDFVRLSSCLNGSVDRRSCPPERPFTPAQVFYLFWLMSPRSWWTLFEVTQLYELIRMIKEGSAPPNSNRCCIANRKGTEMSIKNNVHTFTRVKMHRTPCSHSFLYEKWQLPLGMHNGIAGGERQAGSVERAKGFILFQSSTGWRYESSQYARKLQEERDWNLANVDGNKSSA